MIKERMNVFMNLGEIFEMIKKLQQGDHHGDYKHGNHHDQHKNGYHGKYKSDHHDKSHSTYEPHYSLRREVCSKCGREIDSDHKFCPHCGGDCNASLECKNCHAKAKTGDAFCSRCGNKL